MLEHRQVPALQICTKSAPRLPQVDVDMHVYQQKSWFGYKIDYSSMYLMAMESMLINKSKCPQMHIIGFAD